jgi:hypothetical protein
MLAVVSWVCDCGAHVKVMYDTVGTTTIRCPNASCHNTHIVDGQISEVWIESAGGKWVRHDVLPLVVH